MTADLQTLWDLEDANSYRDRVRDVSKKIQKTDDQVAACRTAWLAARHALVEAQNAVTEWTLAIEPMPPALWLRRLQALEAEIQRAEEEVRRAKQELNGVRASRGRLWDERRVAIRTKFERFPLEEFAARQQADPDTPAADGHAAEDKSWAMRQEAARFAAEAPVETARVPAEQLAEAMAEERPSQADGEAEALACALHTYEGAASRWLKLKEEGATDQQLKEAIGRELGAEGGGSGSGKTPVSYKGGNKPAVWFSVNREGKALTGTALVRRVRELLRIPLPLTRSEREDEEPAARPVCKHCRVQAAYQEGACDSCYHDPRLHPYHVRHAKRNRSPFLVKAACGFGLIVAAHESLEEAKADAQRRNDDYLAAKSDAIGSDLESDADDTSEPWPDCLDRKDVEAAYIGDRDWPLDDPRASKPTKPQTVKVFLWQGKIWCCPHKSGTGARCIYDVVPLLTPDEFAERYPGYTVKLAPHLPEGGSEEDALQYFTGVKVRVGRTDYVICPAGETRRLLWKEQA